MNDCKQRDLVNCLGCYPPIPSKKGYKYPSPPVFFILIKLLWQYVANRICCLKNCSLSFWYHFCWCCILAGLSSILFALTVDSEELNIVKQASTTATVLQKINFVGYVNHETVFLLPMNKTMANLIQQCSHFLQATALTINKDVFNNILPSFPQKPVVEPLPVYSAELTGQYLSVVLNWTLGLWNNL